MQERVFTASEIVGILNDTKKCAERRAELNIIVPDEAKGWTAALVNVAKRFGVEGIYINHESPMLDAEAAERIAREA